MAARLSKSRYMAGLQCPKRLYLEIHARDLAAEFDAGTQAVLDAGTRVGELARNRYPGGVLVDVEHFKVAEGLARTMAILADPAVAVVYEGFIQFQDVLVRPDILVRMGGNRWRLIEVKSTSRAKPEHRDDLAIQAYVLRGAGLAVDAACLMHLNTGYLYPGGPLDLRQLFQEEDLTGEVTHRQGEIPGRLAAMRETLAASDPPPIPPDDHCFAPYECPFWAHCTKEKPARWIFHLPGSRRVYQDLDGLGIQTIDEIPAGYPLQLIQQRVQDDVEWIGPDLRTALATVEYPVHHLDFETLGSAIPLYPNTHPYQAIPFQWSNHIEAADGTLRHEAYLCPDGRDPREELAVVLLRSVGEVGSICTYTGYERGVLTALADALPHLRPDLDRVCARLWDLHPVVRAHYYHPDFEGSYSIKAVLPALVPALAYDDLEIQEGTMASVQFARMAFGDGDAAVKAQIRTALLAYCARDTLAMVEIRRALREKTARPCGN
jgi:CRISPR/Cas system-associated exonuclease Cas4 (RecB family)